MAGFIEKMTTAGTGTPSAPNQQRISRWGTFKEIFLGRFSTVVFVNLLCVLFAAPAVIVFILFSSFIAADKFYIPYSSNIGIGYEVILNAIEIGKARAFGYNLNLYVILIPCIAFAFVGLSGGFYVFRRFVWNEPVKILKDFFYGVKKNWLNFFVAGLLAGALLFVVSFTIGAYGVYNIAKVWKVLSITAAIIVFVLVMMLLMFYTTQSVAYKMKYGVLLKNTGVFFIGLIPTNIVFFALSAIPVAILFIPGIQMVVLMIFLIFGFSYIILVWTCYAHYCYDRFLNQKISGIENVPGAAKPVTEQSVKKEQKQKPTVYKNPKKGKKQPEIMPLSTTFKRDDLKRLEIQRQELNNSENGEQNQADEDKG